MRIEEIIEKIKSNIMKLESQNPVRNYSLGWIKCLKYILPDIEKANELQEEMLKIIIESYKVSLKSLDCEFCSHGYTYNDDMCVGCTKEINLDPYKCKEFEFYVDEMESNSDFEKNFIKKQKFIEKYYNKPWKEIVDEK